MSSRTKGHNFERSIAKYFREELGQNCRTTRSTSRELDACGIDLVGTNGIVQCKAGYDRRRIRFEEEYEYIKERLSEKFDSKHRIQKFPVILITKIDVGAGNKHGPQHTQVTMTLETYSELLKGNVPEMLDII